MDALDHAILEHLKFDGRSSMQDLSELTGLSRSAVFTRVKRLEDQGVITGYTVRLDRKKLGKEIRAYCNVSLKLHERELLEEFEGEIGRHREVRACYHLTGAFDYRWKWRSPTWTRTTGSSPSVWRPCPTSPRCRACS